jgi:hypothetical protein
MQGQKYRRCGRRRRGRRERYSGVEHVCSGGLQSHFLTSGPAITLGASRGDSNVCFRANPFTRRSMQFEFRNRLAC